MAAVAHLAAHPELPRPTLRIGFTPDEEVGGAGAKNFDIARFGADCAYTLDGSTVGEIHDETFTGSKVTLTIQGVDIHTGWAKGNLINAAKLAAGILSALPADTLSPETTDGREGFIHPYVVRSTAVTAVIEAIVRDYEDELLEAHIALLRRTAEDVVAAAPGARLEVAVEHQYPNLKRFLERVPQVVDVADRAVRAEGLEPVRRATRGGTDGCLLSAAGLPTPNLFTGGHEFHSVREWASLQDMATASAVVVHLAAEWARTRWTSTSPTTTS